MLEDPPLHLQYFDCLRRLDRRGAQAIAQGYLDAGGDVDGLYVDVLMPAMIHTGEQWQADIISVAHEHYITEVTRELIRRYGPMLWGDQDEDENRPVAVACCAPGERHTLGLTMVCDVLKAEGVTVHSLGEGAPAEAIREFIIEVKADLLCLSVALGENLGEAKALIAEVRSARPDVAILVGGAAFGGDARRARAIGADHYATDARAVRSLGPAVLRKRAS